MIEETGLPVTDLSLLMVCHKRLVHTLPSGEVEDLQHIGLIYQVMVDRAGRLRKGPDGIDSLGARWLSLGDLPGEPLSPFAAQVLGLEERS